MIKLIVIRVHHRNILIRLLLFSDVLGGELRGSWFLGITLFRMLVMDLDYWAMYFIRVRLNDSNVWVMLKWLRITYRDYYILFF